MPIEAKDDTISRNNIRYIVAQLYYVLNRYKQDKKTHRRVLFSDWPFYNEFSSVTEIKNKHEKLFSKIHCFILFYVNRLNFFLP